MKIWLFLLLPFSLWSELTPLLVGMELQDPPFETVDENGEPYGFSVDLAYALGDYLHRQIEIKSMAFNSLIPTLKAGKIDCIISSMSISPERKKLIAFSQPYMKVGLCLLLSSKTDLKDISEANQKGRVIVVKKATTGEVWAKKHLKKAKLIAFDNVPACISDVVQGKADAFIFDQITVFQANKNYPEETRINLRPFATGECGIGINQDNRELLKQVNDFLIYFKKKNGFEQLKEKFLKEDADAFAKEGIPFYF